MSENIEPPVDTNSPAFKQGVEAALNSVEDTNDWQAGNELGQELKQEDQPIAPVRPHISEDPATPLFLRNDSRGIKGNAQDEKDWIEE